MRVDRAVLELDARGQLDRAVVHAAGAWAVEQERAVDVPEDVQGPGGSGVGHAPILPEDEAHPDGRGPGRLRAGDDGRMPSALPLADPAPADGLLPTSAADGADARAFGVYLHVPFCRVRCGYCDFNTYTAPELRGVRQSDYASQAVQEVRFAGSSLRDSGIPARSASTVFLGGGTPTLLPVEDLVRMLDAVRDLRSPRAPRSRRRPTPTASTTPTSPRSRPAASRACPSACSPPCHACSPRSSAPTTLRA